MSIFAKIVLFISEARQELRHVNWPTRKEATKLTIVVIGLSLALSLFLGAFDYLFSYLLKAFVIKS
ncbi:MAG: preprotein translocase subunit SecE [bacterium]|nr:preprotein translocase subunit SecE [bacterium]